MTFQSFTQQLFGNPAAVFLRKLLIFALEVYLLLILVTKSAFVMSVTFDHFFTNLIESFFRFVFDNVFSENINHFIENNNVFAENEIIDQTPGIWSYIGNYIDIFYNNLKTEPHALRKIVMIFKALVLFSFVFMMIYHIFTQSVKALQYKWVVYIVLKVIIVFLFLLTGAANYLALIDSGHFFNYGTLFSFNMIRSCFAEQKLVILIVFITAARDVVLYAFASIKKH
jgi:hypothetical protein